MDPGKWPPGVAGSRGSPESPLPRGLSRAEEQEWHCTGHGLHGKPTASIPWDPAGVPEGPCPAPGSPWEGGVIPISQPYPEATPPGVCRGSPLTFEVASVCREERGESISGHPFPPSSPSTPNSSLQALGWGSWDPPQGWHLPPPSPFHPPAGSPICGVTPGGAVPAALWDVPPQGPPRASTSCTPTVGDTQLLPHSL